MQHEGLQLHDAAMYTVCGFSRIVHGQQMSSDRLLRREVVNEGSSDSQASIFLRSTAGACTLLLDRAEVLSVA